MEKKTSFWNDSWLYDKPLSSLYPDLFKLCEQQGISVHDFKINPQLVDGWRDDWLNILDDVVKVNLEEGVDILSWEFGPKGRFSVTKSVYNALSNNECGTYHKKIWKSRVPAKIEIFLWLISNNAILTKDNMIKRKWPGEPTCYFCPLDETISHLFFQCSTAKAVWAITAHCLGA